MEYPKNGSVVIIDDKYDEVSELIKVLNRNKVPTLFFDGSIEEIPSDGFDNIRLVFLDINLEGDSFQGTNKGMIVGKLMAILEKTINKKNGQYILVIWSSMTNSFFEDIKQSIQEDQAKSESFLNKHPSSIIEVNKTNVSNIELIQAAISETLNSNESFLKYYILFENMMLESTKEVLNDIDSISTTDATTSKVLSFFSDSKSLDQEDKNPKKLLSKAFGNISHMLYEKMNLKTTNVTRFSEFSPQDITRYAEELESNPNIEDIAMMNTFYHIDDIQTKKFSPGNVYLYSEFLAIACSTNSCNIKWAENLNSKIFDKSLKNRLELKQKPFATLYEQSDKSMGKQEFIDTEMKKVIDNDVIDIFIEISPVCDAAQNKWKKLRLIFGVLVPYDYNINAVGDSFNLCNNMLIEYNKKIYSIALDLQTVSSINHNAFSTLTTIFKFKQEFIVDVQQKVANHFSRPGFFNMNDYVTK